MCIKLYLDMSADLALQSQLQNNIHASDESTYLATSSDLEGIFLVPHGVSMIQGSPEEWPKGWLGILTIFCIVMP